MSYLGLSVWKFCKMEPDKVRSIWNDPAKKKALMETFDKVAKDALAEGETIIKKYKSTTDKDERAILSIQLMDAENDVLALKRAWFYLRELGLIDFKYKGE